jgi:hypothetical protein
MDKIAMNKLEKEYITGRKDQFDINYAVLRKCVDETCSGEDLVNMLEEKLKYVISIIAFERANE